VDTGAEFDPSQVGGGVSDFDSDFGTETDQQDVGDD
jgi:hypothetical protein